MSLSAVFCPLVTTKQFFTTYCREFITINWNFPFFVFCLPPTHPWRILPLRRSTLTLAICCSVETGAMRIIYFIYLKFVSLDTEWTQKETTRAGRRSWPWPSNSSERGTKSFVWIWRKSVQWSPTYPPKTPFCPRWPWPLTLTLTLTFKLILVRDRTRLPCEFGANPFSGLRDISYTKKKVTDSTKNITLCSSLRAVTTVPTTQVTEGRKST